VVDRVEPPGASVNVALLLDSSSSMRRKADQSRAAIAAGLNVFSGLGGPVVVSFDRRVVLYSKPSADLMRFGESTGQPPVGLWATRLYDALDLVLTGPLREMSQRAALVVLTDGVDTASRLADADTVRRRISESHIPVYAIHYDTSRDNPPPPLGGGFELSVNDARSDMTRVLVPEGAGDPGPVHARAADFLRQIVDITGGRLLVAPALDAIENAFAGIARELSEQYLVAYYPTNQNRDGTYRRIRIEVNKPGVTVRARAGYYQASTARTP
jgi:VWFA-related protein